MTPELEQFVQGKVESGLYNNASEVIRESLRLLKEHDEVRLKWRERAQARRMSATFVFTEEAENQLLDIMDHLSAGRASSPAGQPPGG